MSEQAIKIEKPLRLGLEQKATFSRQMAALVDAGFPITKALKVIKNQSKKPTPLKTELEKIVTDLEQGVSLTQAFKRWDPFMVNLIQAGEAGGMLDDVLGRLAIFYEERQRLQNKVITTLTYPVVIFIISFCIFIGMVTLILPEFAQVYARLGGDLPAYTLFWMNLSDTLRSTQGIILLVITLILMASLVQNKEKVISELEKFGLQIPILNNLITHFASTRFSRSLGTLLKCGIPLNKALDLISVSVFPIRQLQNQVVEGIPLNQSMAEHPQLFPEMLISMVAVGEETGELNKLLLKAADYYDQELEGILSRVTSLIEPAIIVILGGLIGSVVVGMYLPMFQLFEQIQ